MHIELPPGKYVVAVSGGVDSMVLLHLLRTQLQVELIVAHFDHGIRADSDMDAQLVERTALAYELPFYTCEGKLGSTVSEAHAREARYAFLHTIRRQTQAEALITAHHQDDVIETAILNLLRGTARRGLSSLQSTQQVRRPLLAIPKAEILSYAVQNEVSWREDTTNASAAYLRNYVRHHIVPRLGTAGRQRMLECVGRADELNRFINDELDTGLKILAPAGRMNRPGFVLLSHRVSREVMGHWLLQAGVELSRDLIERLTIAAKTAKAGSRVDVDKQYWLQISQSDLALELRER